MDEFCYLEHILRVAVDREVQREIGDTESREGLQVTVSVCV